MKVLLFFIAALFPAICWGDEDPFLCREGMAVCSGSDLYRTYKFVCQPEPDVAIGRLTILEYCDEDLVCSQGDQPCLPRYHFQQRSTFSISGSSMDALAGKINIGDTNEVTNNRFKQKGGDINNHGQSIISSLQPIWQHNNRHRRPEGQY